VAISVLVVDDDASFRSTVSELLRTRGYSVVGHACNPEEALRALESLRPDLVLLDVNLTWRNGHDLVGQLTAKNEQASILLTSSDPDASSQSIAVECGAVGFVPKTDLALADLATYVTA